MSVFEIKLLHFQLEFLSSNSGEKIKKQQKNKRLFHRPQFLPNAINLFPPEKQIIAVPTVDRDTADALQPPKRATSDSQHHCSSLKRIHNLPCLCHCGQYSPSSPAHVAVVQIKMK